MLSNAESPEHENETWLTGEEQTALFKEIREDEAAAKLEDAHGTAARREAWRKMLEEKAKAPAAGKAEDRGMALADLRADANERSASDERHREQGKERDRGGQER